MKSKYFDYLESRKGEIDLGEPQSPFVVSAVLRSGKRFFQLEFENVKFYFEHFSSLNDFMLSNELV